MKTKQIRRQIKNAIDDEHRTGRLAAIVRQVANLNGIAIPDQEVVEVVDFVSSYVEQVPDLMEHALQASRNINVESDIRAVLDFAQAYWHEPNDVIPDHLGLAGVLDDAYCTCSLIALFSERCRAQLGTPLFAHNLDAPNRLARSLIGEPTASQLDAIVMQRMNVPQNPLAALMQHLAHMPMPPAMPIPMYINDPMWGTATVDEVVNIRLGAMGVV